MADSEVLSQDEIDALLSHVDSGKVEVGTDESIGSENTQAYDFTGQDRLFSGRMSGLEMINELFAGNPYHFRAVNGIALCLARLTVARSETPTGLLRTHRVYSLVFQGLESASWLACFAVSGSFAVDMVLPS